MPQHVCPRHTANESALLTALGRLAVVADTTDPEHLRGLVAAQTGAVEPLARVLSAIRAARHFSGDGDCSAALRVDPADT